MSNYIHSTEKNERVNNKETDIFSHYECSCIRIDSDLLAIAVLCSLVTIDLVAQLNEHHLITLELRALVTTHILFDQFIYFKSSPK